MRKISYLLILLAASSAFWVSCGKKDKDKGTDKPDTERNQRPRAEKIPEHLLWAISTKAKSRTENDLKKARRAEEGPKISLKKLFELSGDFFNKKQGLSPEDSIVKFEGFDFAFFVPSMAPFDAPSRYALYRRGSAKAPAAISIVDSLGPNNVDVYPFYYENTVLYFIDFYGADVHRQEGRVIPGFFVDDFSGDGPLYFQPVPGKLTISGMGDLHAVMQLGEQLIPERQILLEDGWVQSRSQFRFRDTLQSESRYSYRFGKACEVEWLEDEMVLEELLAYLANNRCGGGVEVIVPKQANNRLPIWVEDANYGYLVSKERSERGIAAKDSATAWMVHSSGGASRPRLKDMPDWKISDLLSQASNDRRKVKRPAEGERLRLGAGWDLRKFAVDTDKPGTSKRSVQYKIDEKGHPVFISLVDSNAHGLDNLEVFPFELKGAVIYFLHYFEKDPAHAEAVEIPGFFLFSDELKKHYYFRPAKGMSVGNLSNLGAVMELENELHVKKALTFSNGKADKLLDYKYEKEGLGKDKKTVELMVTDLQKGDKECGMQALAAKTTLKEVADFLRSPRCGERLGGRKPLTPVWYYPMWVKGTGLEGAENAKDKDGSEKKGKENEKSS